jgi:hypothetical protein
MAIQRANKPYDPTDNPPGTTINTEGGPGYRDHDDGPFHSALNLRRPPKPGVPFGLLVWVIICASITFGLAVTLALVYW